MDFFELLYGFDLLAVFAFALSGALMGLKKQWDFFSVLFLSVITALGGITLRDVLLGQTPVGFLQDIRYTLLCIIASGIVLLFRNQIYRFGRFIKVSDGLGMSALFSTSMTVGLIEHMGFVQSILIGSLVACVGGLIRDLLGDEVPLVFRKELYIIIFLIGGLFYFVLYLFPIHREYIMVSTAVCIFILRVVALHRRWVLPGV